MQNTTRSENVVRRQRSRALADLFAPALVFGALAALVAGIEFSSPVPDEEPVRAESVHIADAFAMPA